MTEKSVALVRRLINACGVVLVVYGAVRASQLYRELRDYSLELLSMQQQDSHPYLEVVKSTPETINLYLTAILLGFVIICFGGDLVGRVFRKSA